MSPVRVDAGSGKAGEIETVQRFCPTCISFHQSRARFLPGEAPELVPPACYFEGRVMRPGWCGGASYHEDIP